MRAPSSRQAHRAYIFTPQQVGALVAAATRLPPSGSLRPHTCRTLFGLLYIAKGKFRKSRWIALSASTACALQQYLDRRWATPPNGPDSPLLLNERRQRLCHPSVRPAFMHLLQECHIPWSRSTGPRIHDLRHTFAVHRLLAWYRDGKDVNARLPALATYMGHVNIASTQVYLQPTAELLGEVHRRFHDHYLTHLISEGTSS